jgi:signal transduction histidine kinase
MSSLATLFDPPEDASAEELRARLRALADLIARAPVPIAVAHDPECRFITANDALARLLAVSPNVNISMTPRVGERPAYRIQRHGRDIPVGELPMQYAIAHRTHVANDIEIVRADGSVLFVQNDVEPLYDRRGEVCGCVSVCVNLTERKHVEDVLREADRRKDEFLATLSHELRNPLAPIRNAVELLRRAGDDPKVAARALAIMERQLHQLVRLTDDLLDISRITRNTIELRRERIDVRMVLRSAIEAIEPLSDAADHVLTVDLPNGPLWVSADFTRMSHRLSMC